MATPFECKLYLDWFRYFDDVSVIGGVPIDHTEYDLAVADYDAGNYDSCWAHIQTAVSNARATLVANYTTLRSISEVTASSISALMLEARGEGINPDAFIKPFNKSLAIFDGEDYIASTHVLNSLYADVSGYVSASRAGRPTDPLSGTYDFPAETTDAIIIEEFHPAPAGWAVKSVDPAIIKSAAMDALASEGITEVEVLEVRHYPPRVVYFLRCPTGFVITAGIIALVAVVTTIVGYWVYRIVDSWLEKRAQEEVEKHKADLAYDYQKWVSERVAAGDLSPEVADDLLNKWNKAMENIKMPEPGMGWMDALIEILPFALVLGVVGFVFSAWRK